MAASGHCFVEWKEQFVSKERGNRVVHYFLKDVSGESILAVVGTERSVRHMFYVVSEEFLNAHVVDSSVHTGFRWRSRREVVNWLTSMLSKQHRQFDRSKSPKDDSLPEISARQTQIPEYKGRLTRNLKGKSSDIIWSGVAWTCGKQLKHYPAYCRNGITIAIQSFVFVMAEDESRYLAYLEDMYEDRKGQKKVRVRWFHHNREVKGIVTLRNPHPKEVFITPYVQVISAECVDGPAIVLTSEHYEKCVAVFPKDLLARIHLCFRQFKNNRVKAFNLSNLRGYLDQPIFSCFGPDFFEDEEFSPGDNVKLGAKRTRSCRGRQMMTYEPPQRLNNGSLKGRLISHNHFERQVCQIPPFKVDEKIELLCQDSGIRGCWFRCTVLHVSRRQMKVQYDDLKDEDGCGNLEEWVPAVRIAMPDKLGMRYSGRPTIRPAVPHDEMIIAFEVGTSVDAWWSDGWWEGFVTGIDNSKNDCYQVFIPSETLFLNVDIMNLRVSRDWVGDKWMDVDAHSDILSVISAAVSPDAKLSVSSDKSKEVKYDDCVKACIDVSASVKLNYVEEEKLELAHTGASNALPDEMDCVNDEKLQLIEEIGKNNSTCVDENDEKDIGADNVDDDNNDDVDEVGLTEKLGEIQELETGGQSCETELIEVDA